MSNKILFSLIHLCSLYFTLEEYPLWFTLTGLIINLLSLTPIKHKKILAQVGVLIVIYVHFSYYKKLFDPESASALLSNMLYLKYFMLKDKEEFNRNVVLSFLNIAAISLFNSNLFFIVFLILASFLFLQLLNANPYEKFKFSIGRFLNPQILKLFFYGVPIALLLFFIFPRLPNFFPVAGSLSEGKIGYSKDINNSSISTLETSSQIAFRAQMSKLNPELLYWRGRILNSTNGYNWNYHAIKGKVLDQPVKGNLTQYSIKAEQSFGGDIITLDAPVDIITTFKPEINPGLFFTSYRARKKISYEGISVLAALVNEKPDKSFSKVPPYVPKILKRFLENFSKEDSLKENVEKFRQYIVSEGFSYTLSPGELPTLQSFLEAKKGFCTHYSSLMALVFRHLGHPTRVVSGFQGGEYNEIGGYYTVRSNDAHAWVEIHNNGKWHRFDPTGFISPLRIELGGDGFVNQGVLGTNIQSFFGKDYKGSEFYAKYYEIKQWLDNLNYQVALFIESFDIEKQKELYAAFNEFFKNNKEKFILVFLSLFFLGVLIFLIPFKDFFRPKQEKLLSYFEKYLFKKHNIKTNRKMSFMYISILLEGTSEEKRKIKEWIALYQSYRYANLSKDEKKEIEKKLKLSLKH